MTYNNQRALKLPGPRVQMDFDAIARQPSGHAVIVHCASAAGKVDKVVADVLGIQDAVWSRVKSGQNSLSLEHLVDLMTLCGNDAPLIWLLIKRGYDPHSLRPSESEAERRIREREELCARREAEAAEKIARANMRADIAMELAKKAVV